MLRLILAMAVLLCSPMLSGCLSSGLAVATQTTASNDEPYGGDWSQQAFQRLVRGPVRTGQQRGREAGAAHLDRLLLEAEGDYEKRTRLLYAYGTQAYPDVLDEVGMLSYLRRAVADARHGPIPGRRLATLLSDYAGEALLNGDAGDRAAGEAAATEALAIRVLATGAASYETAMSNAQVGGYLGEPSHTRGDPQRVSEANRYFERLFEFDPSSIARMDPNEDAELAATVLFQRWASMLAKNGQSRSLCAVLDRMAASREKFALNIPYIVAIARRDLATAGHGDDLPSLSAPTFDGSAGLVAHLDWDARNAARERGELSWCAP